MSIEEDKKNNPSVVQAPSGTYEYLFGLRGRIFNTQDYQVGYSIQEERLCPETGGSCMDLQIVQKTDVGQEELHAHVTNTNTIVVLENVTYDRTQHEWRRGPTPDISHMINKIKDLRSRYDNPYERLI